MIICRNPSNKKWLAINETKNRGWWIPGGAVDEKESFSEAAIRECWEEARINIKIIGILKINNWLFNSN